ncbi:MAG: hypothetical protein ABR884_04330 [Minisyncoccia bacterium]
MKIHADDELISTLEQLFAGIEEECAIVLIDKKDANGIRQTASGLDDALALIRERTALPIVLLGWLTEEHYAKDVRWAEVRQSPHVAFRRLPAAKEDVVSALAEITSAS